jgi:molybdate transport system regulatory protein
MASPPTLKIVLRLYCGSEIAMGPGKADLLEAIASHGSISAAGRAMGMSYRRAWRLVDTMNRCWKEPLVATAPGSSHGGGARLTGTGERVLAHFRALQRSVETATQGPDRQVLDAAMLAAPRLSQKD